MYKNYHKRANLQICFDAAGSIRVFINGKATKLPTRPVDMRGVFGQDLILVHPTGVPVNEFGFDLEHGESYFLVCVSYLYVHHH